MLGALYVFSNLFPPTAFILSTSPKIRNSVAINIFLTASITTTNVLSEIKSFTKTSFLMKQSVLRDNELIAYAEVCLVSVNKKGKPVKMPNELSKKLEN